MLLDKTLVDWTKGLNTKNKKENQWKEIRRFDDKLVEEKWVGCDWKYFDEESLLRSMLKRFVLRLFVEEWFVNTNWEWDEFVEDWSMSKVKITDWKFQSEEKEKFF